MERSAYLKQTAMDWLYQHPCRGTQDNICRAFVAGAEWADAHPENIWHPLSERPKPEEGGSSILYWPEAWMDPVVACYGPLRDEVDLDEAPDGYSESWKVRENDPGKWCYIKDLS